MVLVLIMFGVLAAVSLYGSLYNYEGVAGLQTGLLFTTVVVAALVGIL